MQQHFNFLRCALDKLQTDVREKLAKCFNHGRQTVACLRVGSGDGQHARGVIGEEIGQTANVAGLVENTLSNSQQCLARLRHPQQTLTAADENLNTELFFQLTNMAAHARLRGVKHIGDFSQVVIPPGRLTNNFKLLEIHDSLRRL